MTTERFYLKKEFCKVNFEDFYEGQNVYFTLGYQDDGFIFGPFTKFDSCYMLNDGTEISHDWNSNIQYWADLEDLEPAKPANNDAERLINSLHEHDKDRILYNLLVTAFPLGNDEMGTIDPANYYCDDDYHFKIINILQREIWPEKYNQEI